VGLELDHGQASRQLHLEIHVLRGYLALDPDRNLGLSYAGQDPALSVGVRTGTQSQTRTILGDGSWNPGYAKNGKQGEDEGQAHDPEVCPVVWLYLGGVCMCCCMVRGVRGCERDGRYILGVSSSSPILRRPTMPDRFSSSSFVLGH